MMQRESQHLHYMPMQYIVTASLGKLYTFTVTEEVLHELERHIHTYIAANTENGSKVWKFWK